MNFHKRLFLAAVTQRVDTVAGRAENRDALDQRLTDWLLSAGGLAFPVPNALGPEALNSWLHTVQPDLLVLSGGNDIGKRLERDATEKRLLDWAESKRLPTLGICRGMQMMAVWAGSNLVSVSDHAGVRHNLKLDADENADEWPASVNSYHNWGLEHVPAGFKATAWAENQLVEAMRSKSLPWEGWMWHPEREAPFSEVDIKRLVRLLNEQ